MKTLNEMTLGYIKTRVQFGQPIGKFQVLQHRMVDMYIAHEEAKSMAMMAAKRVGEDSEADRRKAMSAAKRSEEHTSELQSLMRISYAVFCLKKKNNTSKENLTHQQRIHN